jgi:hypothetical protein
MKDNGFFAARYKFGTECDNEVRVRKNAITPHPCSSYCCGNPRKWFGDLTLQEQRANDWEAILRECIEGNAQASDDYEK